MSFKSFICTIALVPAITLVACGGGDDDSGDDFTAQADAICVDSAERINAVFAEQGTPADAEEAAAVDAALLDSRVQEIEALEALEPPEDLAGGYEDFVAARSEIRAGEELRQAANEQGDQQAAEDAAAYIDEAFAAADDAAEDIGLEACAGILPTDEEDAARAAAEQFFTAATAEELKTACEQATDAYIDAIGGLEVCHEPGEPTTIEISDVSGVSGITAEVSFVPNGGPEDGQDLRAFFVYQDGEWKVDALSQAPSPVEPGTPAGDGSVRQAYDRVADEVNDAIDTFDARVANDLGAGNLEAVKADAAKLRTAIFDFDAALREIPFPDALTGDVNAVLDANGTVIADLDAVGGAATVSEAGDLVDRFREDFKNLLGPATVSLSEGL